MQLLLTEKISLSLLYASVLSCKIHYLDHLYASSKTEYEFSTVVYWGIKKKTTSFSLTGMWKLKNNNNAVKLS